MHCCVNKHILNASRPADLNATVQYEPAQLPGLQEALTLI
jgi:hypothetical protein